MCSWKSDLQVLVGLKSANAVGVRRYIWQDLDLRPAVVVTKIRFLYYDDKFKFFFKFLYFSFDRQYMIYNGTGNK